MLVTKAKVNLSPLVKFSQEIMVLLCLCACTPGINF